MSLLGDLQIYRDRLANRGLAEEVLPSLEASTNTRDKVESAGASLPFALPPSLIDYLTAPVVPGIEWNEVSVPSNENLEAVFALLNESTFWEAQLARIATGPNSDPVCLDLSRPLYDGEYPVVVVSRDRVPADGWSDAKKVRKFVSLEFSDFAVMLHFCCHGVPFDFRTKFGK